MCFFFFFYNKKNFNKKDEWWDDILRFRRTLQNVFVILLSKVLDQTWFVEPEIKIYFFRFISFVDVRSKVSRECNSNNFFQFSTNNIGRWMNLIAQSRRREIQRILKIREEREREEDQSMRRNFPRHGFTKDRASIKWSKLEELRGEKRRKYICWRSPSSSRRDRKKDSFFWFFQKFLRLWETFLTGKWWCAC